MKNNQTDTELNITENAETLWENFEKTGSVTAYLLYVRKMDKRPEVLSAQLPS